MNANKVMNGNLNSAGNMAGCRVLVVDDSPTCLAYTRKALESRGAEVQTSESLWVAPLLRSFKPDVVLLDVFVAGCERGGLSLVEAIKKGLGGLRPGIFLYSSLDTRELKVLAREHGLDGYITKRDEHKDMLLAIQGYMAKRDREQEYQDSFGGGS